MLIGGKPPNPQKENTNTKKIQKRKITNTNTKSIKNLKSYNTGGTNTKTTNVKSK